MWLIYLHNPRQTNSQIRQVPLTEKEEPISFLLLEMLKQLMKLKFEYVLNSLDTIIGTK